MSDENLSELRAKAREAMEGPERRTKQEEISKEIDEKRRAAAFAMEGVERRQRREAKERELKEKQEMLRRIDEEVKRREEEAKRKKEEAETARRNEAIMHEQEIKQKENAYSESQNTIQKLKEERGTTLKAIHTLQSDLADAVKSENITAEKIAIAEQTKKAQAQSAIISMSSSKQNGSGIFRLITILVLLISIALVSGAAYWYAKNNKKPVAAAPITVQSIIFAEKSIEVNSTKLPKSDLVSELNKIATSPKSDGELITNLYFTKDITDGSSSTRKELISFPEWQSYTESSIPESFSRFVSQYMVGIHRDNTGSTFFLTFKIDPFDNTYQTILDHENDWVRDIYKSINGKNILAETQGNSFSDYILKNLNTRILKDPSGKTAMIYTFLDPNTLVIAQSEAALYQAYTSYNTPRPRN